jgi:hypothetical protein
MLFTALYVNISVQTEKYAQQPDTYTYLINFDRHYAQHDTLNSSLICVVCVRTIFTMALIHLLTIILYCYDFNFNSVY